MGFLDLSPKEQSRALDDMLRAKKGKKPKRRLDQSPEGRAHNKKVDKAIKAMKRGEVVNLTDLMASKESVIEKRMRKNGEFVI